eukprot:1362197-Amorphochlora_amoeboformis.AAC.1
MSRWLTNSYPRATPRVTSTPGACARHELGQPGAERAARTAGVSRDYLHETANRLRGRCPSPSCFSQPSPPSSFSRSSRVLSRAVTPRAFTRKEQVKGKQKPGTLILLRRMVETERINHDRHGESHWNPNNTFTG